MDIIAKGSELLKYIPQRPPFVFVDTLYEVTEKQAVSGLRIQENVLNKNNIFQESGLIENMAQTCALFAGFKASEMGENAPLGFIAAIKSVTVHNLPELNDEIITKIEIVNELMDMQIAQAVVYNKQDQEIASCELRIFIKKPTDAD